MSKPLIPNVIAVLGQGSVEYIDHMGDDLRPVNAARVSFNKGSNWVEDEEGNPVLKEEDGKLLKYLAKHNHWTPFAHPQITLRIKAPISIRTQLFKHKVSFVESEISRRYVKDIPDTYIPIWRGAPTDGAKQGSSDFIDKDTAEQCTALYASSVSTALRIYQHLIEEHGIAPEQARMILPQGMFTEWYWTGSLAAYSRVYKLRKNSHAQWEVQEYARAIGEIMTRLFPVSWEALTG